MNMQRSLQIPPLSKTIKILIALNVFIWLFLQILAEGYGGIHFNRYFALFPGKVLLEGAVWQLVTYMFLHSLNVSHVVFNMVMLWFIGSELEERWGSKFFVAFYFMTGIGAAIIYCAGIGAYASATGNHQGLVIPVVGASGAIFGLLLAYGILFGERVIHFMMIFPMKAKIFVLILGGIEAISLVSSGVAGGDVANLAHLGGLISGYFALIASNRFQRFWWTRKAKKKGRSNLRLVVNNDSQKDKNQPPKYWN